MNVSRVVGKGDLPALARSLARAFVDDPVAIYAFSDAATRLDRLRRFFHVQLRHNYYPRGEIYATGDATGCAMWLPPRSTTPTMREAFMQLPLFVTTLVQTRTMIRLAHILARIHPTDAHYYLGTIGVRPDYQRSGAATALLAPVLERCDALKIPAYLESSTEQNTEFYGHRGFVVTNKIDSPNGGPPIWLMWREPQTQAVDTGDAH